MIKDIKVGSCESFILLENGDLWGSGRNCHGELGIGHTEQAHIFKKICEEVEKVEIFSNKTFLFKKDKTLWFAGHGYYLGKKDYITSFVKVADDAESVFFWEPYMGKESLFCLKNNGELLDLKEFKIYLSDIKKIIEGFRGKTSYLFFIRKDDSLLCLGANGNKKLIPFSDVKNVFSSCKSPLFIQKTDDSLWKVEKNNYKESVKIFDNIKSVEVVRDSSFFLRKNGDLFVLGKNHYGELGIDQKKVDVPVLVAKDVKEVCSFPFFTFILKNDNSLWGCGKNYYNILGNEPEDYCFSSFKKIDDNVKNFYLDGSSLFVIKQNDELWASGWFTRHLQKNNYLRFVSDNVKNIFWNSPSFFIVKKDNTLLCSGSNGFGQLGLDSEKKWINDFTECTAIKNYYSTKETAEIMKDILKENSL